MVGLDERLAQRIGVCVPKRKIREERSVKERSDARGREGGQLALFEIRCRGSDEECQTDNAPKSHDCHHRTHAPTAPRSNLVSRVAASPATDSPSAFRHRSFFRAGNPPPAFRHLPLFRVGDPRARPALRRAFSIPSARPALCRSFSRLRHYSPPPADSSEYTMSDKSSEASYVPANMRTFSKMTS